MRFLRLFFEPIISLAKASLVVMPYWILLLLCAYLCSNIQILPPEERALIFRFGALQHEGTAQAIQGPGLIFALPSPIDRVFRYPAQKVYSLAIEELHIPQRPGGGFLSSKTLDPEKVGYILSADHNLLHIRLSLRYRISSAPLFFLAHSNPQESLRSLVLSTVVSQSGQRDIDTLLTSGREKWVETIQQQLVEKIAAQELGVEVVSLEVMDMQVPSSVRNDFQAVQSAAVDAQTQEQEAKAYRAEQIPKANSWSSNEINTAREYSLSTIADANAEVKQFRSLISTDPQLLKTRLYRERLKHIFSDVGSIRFVPPPKTKGMRITITEGQRR